MVAIGWQTYLGILNQRAARRQGASVGVVEAGEMGKALEKRSGMMADEGSMRTAACS